MKNLWLSLYFGDTPFYGTITPINIHLFFFNKSLFATSSNVKSFKVSNLIGTFAALNTYKTESKKYLFYSLLVISGPIPIPGIKVTFFNLPSSGRWT